MDTLLGIEGHAARIYFANFAGMLKLSAEPFFFKAEDGIRDTSVPGVQTCALPIWREDREDHYQPGIGGPRTDRSAGPGRLLHQPHRFHPNRHSHPTRHPGRGPRPDSGPAYAHSG